MDRQEYQDHKKLMLESPPRGNGNASPPPARADHVERGEQAGPSSPLEAKQPEEVPSPSRAKGKKKVKKSVLKRLNIICRVQIDLTP